MVDLESRVKFNHETAEQEVARRDYAHGQHFACVTAAIKQLSKEKEQLPGVQYKMIVLTFKPLRDPIDITSVVGRGRTVYQCLPFWDDSWDELDYEVPTKDGAMSAQAYLKRNMGIFAESIRDLLTALVPGEVQARPAKQPNGTYLFNGEERQPEEFRECNTVSKVAAGEVAERLWNDGPEELVSKCAYILVQAQKDNPQYSEIKRYGAEQLVDWKTGEQLPLVDSNSIMVAQGQDEEGEEEEGASNGAKGKATASKATVAAAAKLNKGKKPAGKAARK